MNPTSHPIVTTPAASSPRNCARLAVALAVAGVVCFVVLSLLRVERAAVGCAFVAEFLAFICAILGWRERAARVVVFSQLAVLALFAASVVLWNA